MSALQTTVHPKDLLLDDIHKFLCAERGRRERYSKKTNNAV
jgi:hypothetical protein